MIMRLLEDLSQKRKVFGMVLKSVFLYAKMGG